MENLIDPVTILTGLDKTHDAGEAVYEAVDRDDEM